MNEQQLRFGWYLIGCFPGLLYTAEAALWARGLETYVAQRYWRERVGHRSVTRTEPRFAEYAFVRLAEDPSDGDFLAAQAAAVCLERGVAKVFATAAGKPARVPDREISMLRAMEADEKAAATKRRPRQSAGLFASGQRVRVVRYHVPAIIGCEGDVIFSARGQTRVALENGIALAFADGDIAECVQRKRA